MAVAVGALVAGMGVKVGVAGTRVAVGVAVLEDAVGVGGLEVKVAVGARGVKVAVGLFPVSTTSCGAFAPDSRLAKFNAVELDVAKARFHVPLPLIYEVTSIASHNPAVTAPEEPTMFPSAGAFS